MINMKKLSSILLVFLFVVCGRVSAQETADISKYDVADLEFRSVCDTEYEWSQFDEKKSKAIIEKERLTIESKDDGQISYSVCEVPVNMRSDDFLVALKMSPESIDDKKPFGLIYDFKNDANFKAIVFLKKSFQIIECTDNEKYVVKKGLYKGKGKDFIISIMRKNNKLTFTLNDMYLTSQSNSELNYPVFGFVILNKGKLYGKEIALKKVHAKDSEE